MSAPGTVLLVLFWGLIIVLNAFCFYRVLKKKELR
jgi:hypothetical protein